MTIVYGKIYQFLIQELCAFSDSGVPRGPDSNPLMIIRGQLCLLKHF